MEVNINQKGKIILKFKEQFFPEDMNYLIFNCKLCSALWRTSANMFHDEFIYSGIGNIKFFIYNISQWLGSKKHNVINKRGAN